MRRASMLLLLMALPSGLPGLASGQLTSFRDRVAWESAVGRPVGVETFDEFTQDTSFRSTPLDLAAFSLTSVPPREGLFDFHNTVQVAPFGSSGSSFTTPHVWLFVEGDSALHVQMSFYEPIDAWGADFFDTSGGELAQLRITFDDDSETTIDLPSIGDQPGFFGLLGDGQKRIDGIGFVSVADGNLALGNSLKLDGVSGTWAVIPEPSTGLLVGLGMLGLAGWRRFDA